jgi:sulfite reductase (ferredoxin)
MLEDLTKVPAHGEDASYYADWGDPREFTTGDMGTGECAGEVVSLVEFDLADAERELFEAQLLLEAGDHQHAETRAYRAMVQAAKALVRTQFLDVGDDPDRIVEEFRIRFVETELFDKEFASGKFAQYLLRQHGAVGRTASAESAHQLIEEASLFVEAGHACHLRMAQMKGAPASAPASQVVTLESLA